MAPDLIVYFGDLEWRSVGQVGAARSARCSPTRTTPAPTGPTTTGPAYSPWPARPGSQPVCGRGLRLIDVGPIDPVPVRIGRARRRRREGASCDRITHDEKGFTVWFTGLSGAGKSTLAEMLFHELRRRDMKIELLDGDVVRTNLSKGLGFSKEDRDTNILRIGFVANLLTRNGVGVITSAISPLPATRATSAGP